MAYRRTDQNARTNVGAVACASVSPYPPSRKGISQKKENGPSKRPLSTEAEQRLRVVSRRDSGSHRPGAPLYPTELHRLIATQECELLILSSNFPIAARDSNPKAVARQGQKLSIILAGRRSPRYSQADPKTGAQTIKSRLLFRDLAVSALRKKE
jgi:hypothetical protein